MSSLEKSISELHNNDLFVRARAAQSIRLYGAAARQAVPALVTALSDPSFIVQVAAVKAISAIGPAACSAVPRLIAMLDDEALALYAAPALGRMGREAKSALPRLKNLLVRSEEDVGAPTALAVYRIDPSRDAAEDAVARLAAILVYGKSGDARACAAVGLGEIAGKRASFVLRNALNDDDALVRFCAAGALEHIEHASPL